MPVFPQINLNGNSPEVLIKQYEEAIEALATARDKVALIDVHGRDYQILNNFSDANKEHLEVLHKIEVMIADYKLVRRSIMKQMFERGPEDASSRFRS